MSDTAPRLFVSYSWTSPDHEAWVLNLATELRGNGVDVVLDKWDLREGNDAYAFMEKMVSDESITKVILVCDRLYAEKADGRSGGVGVETQIITPDIYVKEDQDKFVAIVTERDDEGHACLPAYYKSRVYIDLSDPSRYAENYEQLLRWAHDKPLHVKPEIGSVPAFLSEETAIMLGTSAVYNRAIDSVRNGRSYWSGAVGEYLTVFVKQLERFRISETGSEPDELFITNIEAFLPYRNQAIELFMALSQYQDNEQASRLLHRFFEQLLPYLDRPDNVNSWRDTDFDNFCFIVHELFLYAVAILLKYERFDLLGALLRPGFYCPYDDTTEHGMVSFNFIYRRLELLDVRKQRLKLNRLSLHADILKERSESSGIPFGELMQADFVLYVHDSLDCLSIESGWRRWHPNTLVFNLRQNKPFEVFARSRSRAYFARLCKALNINTKDQIDELMKAFSEQKLRQPYWEPTHFVSVQHAIGYEALATRP